jgi:hypothetical protein
VLSLPNGQILTSSGNRLVILNSDDEIVMELVGHSEVMSLPSFSLSHVSSEGLLSLCDVGWSSSGLRILGQDSASVGCGYRRL